MCNMGFWGLKWSWTAGLLVFFFSLWHSHNTAVLASDRLRTQLIIYLARFAIIGSICSQTTKHLEMYRWTLGGSMTLLLYCSVSHIYIFWLNWSVLSVHQTSAHKIWVKGLPSNSWKHLYQPEILMEAIRPRSILYCSLILQSENISNPLPVRSCVGEFLLELLCELYFSIKARNSFLQYFFLKKVKTQYII